MALLYMFAIFAGVPPLAVHDARKDNTRPSIDEDVFLARNVLPWSRKPLAHVARSSRSGGEREVTYHFVKEQMEIAECHGEPLHEDMECSRGTSLPSSFEGSKVYDPTLHRMTVLCLNVIHSQFCRRWK